MCPSQERRDCNDSVSCKEPAGRSDAQNLPDALKTLKDASQFAGDVHSSRAAPQLHSPTLMGLRRASVAESDDTGGRGRATRVQSNVEAKQRVLATKHQNAKSSACQVVGVGGGVTMWPGMDDMRLSQRETVQLTAVAVCLIAGSMCLFIYMHGVWHPTIVQLRTYMHTPHTS